VSERLVFSGAPDAISLQFASLGLNGAFEMGSLAVAAPRAAALVAVKGYSNFKL
jgi:hypothetical protein